MLSYKFEIGETVFLLPSLCFFFLPFLAKTEDLIATYQDTKMPKNLAFGIEENVWAG